MGWKESTFPSSPKPTKALLCAESALFLFPAMRVSVCAVLVLAAALAAASARPHVPLGTSSIFGCIPTWSRSCGSIQAASVFLRLALDLISGTVNNPYRATFEHSYVHPHLSIWGRMYAGADCPNDDVGGKWNPGQPIAQLVEQCLSTPGCVGFNTNGFLKNGMRGTLFLAVLIQLIPLLFYS